MIATSFTNLVGVSAPIQLAAMPGISTPDLVAAVADAGGLGMLGAPLMSAAVLEGVLEQLSERTKGVFGVNFLDPACVSVAARRAAPFVSPNRLIVRLADAALERRGALVAALESMGEPHLPDDLVPFMVPRMI